MQPYEGGGADSRALSRRDLLKGAGIVGVAAAAPTAAMAPTAAPVRPRERLEALTAAEAETVEAMVDRLIPSDATGPGAGSSRASAWTGSARPAPPRSGRLPSSLSVQTHAYGGTRMGDDPDVDVTDRWCFSHEVPNLGVLGASNFPTSGGRNPTETVTALAWRTADHLVDEWEAITG